MARFWTQYADMNTATGHKDLELRGTLFESRADRTRRNFTVGYGPTKNRSTVRQLYSNGDSDDKVTHTNDIIMNINIIHI